MGRPLTGRKQRNRDGSWAASLPAERGSTRRVQYAFPTEAEADRWLRAGIEAIKAGFGPPRPAAALPHGRRPLISGVTVAQACREWHASYYTKRRRADVERAADVERMIERHIVPFFAARTRSVAEVDQPLLDEFIDHLAKPPALAPLSDLGGPDELLTAVQISDRLREVSTSKVYRYVRLGRLPVAGTDGAGRRVHRVADVRTSGLLAGRLRGLSREYATDITTTLTKVIEYSVARGWLDRYPLTKDTSGARPLGVVESRDRTPITYDEAARVTRHLHPVHQLVFWMLRILGLRIGEAFGPRVGDVITVDGVHVINIDKQGGRTFTYRDSFGHTVKSDTKQGTKSTGSTTVRMLVLPDTMWELIQTVIEVFHTDPDTGEVDLNARLVPGLTRANAGGQSAFRAALGNALRTAGLSEDHGCVGPHALRMSLTTDLAWDRNLEDLWRRRFSGHAAGSDVFARVYTLDHPDLAPMQEVARSIETTLRGTIHDLRVPTTKRLQHRSGERSIERHEEIELELRLRGWIVDEEPGDDPLLGAAQVARLLGLAESVARRHMRAGALPIEMRTGANGKPTRMARRSEVLRLRDQRDSRVQLRMLAGDLEVSYHELYRTVGRLGLRLSKQSDRGLVLKDADVEAVRAEYRRLSALRARSLPLREVANDLGISDWEVRRLIERGELQVDTDTDATGRRYVTKKSIERLQAVTASAPTPDDPPEALTIARVARTLRLSTTMVNDLIARGLLTTVPAGRARAIEPRSLMRWLCGYRPDLLEFAREIGLTPFEG